MFNFLKKKPKAPRSSISAFVKLNAKVMPIDRGERFEDPLQEVLEKSGCAEVTGGGTGQKDTGEINYSGIDIDIFDLDAAVPLVCTTLTKLGAPKGSVLQYTKDGKDVEVPFGKLEGIAVYLNGTDLGPEVYQNSDVNVVIEEINKAIKGKGAAADFWEGPTETALYLYGESADEMKSLIGPFMASYPLCQRARIERIA